MIPKMPYGPKHPELIIDIPGVRISQLTQEELFQRFVTPSAEHQDEYDVIHSMLYAVAYQLNQMCPDSREKSLAITKLEEAAHWAVASYARKTPKEPSAVGAQTPPDLS